MRADVHDELTLVRLLAGADAVVNLVGILHARDVGLLVGSRRAAFEQAELAQEFLHQRDAPAFRREALEQRARERRLAGAFGPQHRNDRAALDGRRLA